MTTKDIMKAMHQIATSDYNLKYRLEYIKQNSIQVDNRFSIFYSKAMYASDGHKWASRENIVARPKVCPKCKSAYWDTPKRQQ
jgi:hypothetical protein